MDSIEAVATAMWSTGSMFELQHWKRSNFVHSILLCDNSMLRLVFILLLCSGFKGLVSAPKHFAKCCSKLMQFYCRC